MNNRDDDYHGFDKDTWPQIQFHNERIYKNLELFIQITLAISGGLAYLAVNKVTGNNDLIVYVVRMAAWFQILIGLYTSVAIVMHVLSTFRRYKDKNNLWRKSVAWLEPYMILFIFAVSGLVAYVAYFKMAVTIVSTAP